MVDFEAEVTHKIAISWREDLLSVAADGHLLTPCHPDEDIGDDKLKLKLDLTPPTFLWADENAEQTQ